jgi:hypothetical protein
MKYLCQKAKDDESGFHEIGTTGQMIFSHYQSDMTALRYGILPYVKDGISRTQVYAGDHIYGDHHRVIYTQFGRVWHQSHVEKLILIFLPRENALGRTGRQIASDLKIASVIIDDMLADMMAKRKLTYDATGYCWRGEKRVQV